MEVLQYIGVIEAARNLPTSDTGQGQFRSHMNGFRRQHAMGQAVEVTMYLRES